MWETNSFQVTKKISRTLWNPLFRNSFTWAHHFYLSCARWIQTSPSHYISLSWILLLSSKQRLGFLCCFLLPFSPINAKCTSRNIFLDLFTLIIFGEVYESLNFSLRNFLQPCLTSSLLAHAHPLPSCSANNLSLCF